MSEGGLGRLLFDHPFDADRPLLHGAERSLTKGEAVERAERLAGELSASGVAAGQAVGVHLPNGPEALAALFGVWRAGAVLVPVNPRLPGPEVERVLATTGAAAVVEPGGIRAAAGDRRYREGTAFVLWTSGTTGEPKPVLHTHDGYLEVIDRVLAPLRGRSAGGTGRPGRRGGAPGGSGAKDRHADPSPNLIPVPLSSNAGLYNALFGLRAGAPLVIMERFEAGAFAALVHRFAIRSTVLPPAAMVALNDEPTVESLTPLRYVRSITSPLSPLQARRFTERFGVAVLNGYGQAEIGEVIGWTAADAREHPDRVGAVGRPHPGVAVKVVDEAGEPLERGAVGELLVRPPSMAAGYATGDLSERLDPEGYVRTGDLAVVDEASFVWIQGRLGDVINRGGNKVFPDEVEEVIRLDRQVRDAAVVGVADRRLGEVPVAFVVVDHPRSAAELEALCRQHLVAYKVPVAFVESEGLPRNEAGKLLRRELARRWAGGHDASR